MLLLSLDSWMSPLMRREFSWPARSYCTRALPISQSSCTTLGFPQYSLSPTGITGWTFASSFALRRVSFHYVCKQVHSLFWGVQVLKWTLYMDMYIYISPYIWKIYFVDYSVYIFCIFAYFVTLGWELDCKWCVQPPVISILVSLRMSCNFCSVKVLVCCLSQR